MKELQPRVSRRCPICLLFTGNKPVEEGGKAWFFWHGKKTHTECYEKFKKNGPKGRQKLG
jgi:hypothetical protein